MTTPGILPSREQEEKTWDYIEQVRSRQRSARDRANPTVGRLVEDLRDRYPQLDEDEILGLAFSGYGPDTTQAQQIANLKVEKQKDDGFGFGDILKAGGGVLGGIFRPVAGVAGEVGGRVADVARPALRTAFTALETPIQEFTGQVGEILAGSAEGLQTFGTIAGTAAGATAGAALAPFTGGASLALGAVGGGLLGGAAGGFLGDVVGGGEPPQAHSTGLIALGQLAPGGAKLDIGSGFFSGGGVRREQSDVMRAIGNDTGLGDRAFTLGRYVAKPLQPGSLPFNIVSGVTDLGVMLGDPSFVAAKVVGRAAKAGREFTPFFDDVNVVGRTLGIRPTVIPEKFDQWLASGKTGKVLDWYADKDAGEIYLQLSKGGKRDVPTGLVIELDRAGNSTDVAQIFRKYVVDHRQMVVRPTAPFSGVTGTVREALPGSWPTYFSNRRTLGMLPEDDLFNAKNPERLLANIESTLRNGKVPLAERQKVLTKAVRELRTDGIGDIQITKGLYGVLTNDLVDAQAAVLAQRGLAPENVKKLTRFLGAEWGEHQGYLLDEITGNPAHHVLAHVDDATGMVSATPFLPSQMVLHKLPNFDWKTIRTATTSRNLFTYPEKVPRLGGKVANPMRSLIARADAEEIFEPRAWVAFMDLATTHWKPWAILRGAYITRVGGINQARLAANGGISPTHPMDWLNWIRGRAGQVDFKGRPYPKAWGDTAKQLEGVEAKIAKLGDDAPAPLLAQRDELMEQANRLVADDMRDYARSLSGNFGSSVRVSALQRNGRRVRVRRGEREFDRGVAEAVAMWADDGLAREVLGMDVDDAVNWFVRGDGRKVRSQMMRNPAGESLADDAVATRYIEQVFDYAKKLVGDDQELLEALRTNRFRGKRLLKGDNTVAPDFRAAVRDKVDADTWNGTDWAAIDDVVRGAGTSPFGKANKRATDFLIRKIVTMPDNVLARSPEFRRQQWGWLADHGDALSAEAQQELLGVLPKANLPKKLDNRIRAAFSRGAGTLSADEADLVSKIHAATRVGDLLFDWSRKGQFFNIHRNLFPFGEAWKEEITVWSKILRDNPGAARRFQQGIEGLRSEELAQTLAGIPVVGLGIPQARYNEETGEWEDAGFFHVNSNGEEVFTYPFSGWFTEKLFNVPVPLAGRVQGLSLIGEVLPGIGPVTQIPLAKIVPETPQWDEVRNILFPFGEPSTKTLGGPLETFVPSWAKKAILIPAGVFPSPEQVITYGNSVKSVAAFLVSSGQVKRPQTEGEIRELMEQAEGKAKGLWFIRGLASAVGAPSAPSFEWMAMDKDGTLAMVEQLRVEMRKFQEEDPANALSRFLLRHGEQAFLHVNAFSDANTYGAPVTREGIDWARSNGKVRNALPDVYGLFAPPGGDFDYSAYLAQFFSRDRRELSFEEWIQAGNNRLARNIYSQAKLVTGPNPNSQQQAVLRQLRSELVTEYPGYWPGLRQSLKITPEQAVEQLRDSLNVDQLQDHPALAALNVYFAARDVASSSGETPSTFARAAAGRRARESLRFLAQELITRIPEFEPMWDQVLSRELTEDLD